jgi:hypothetical protein
VFKILTNLLPQKNTILQVIICDELRKGSMLNSGNNDWEQNWLLLSPRVERGLSDCNPWMSKMENLGGHLVHFQLQNNAPICLQIPSKVAVTLGKSCCFLPVLKIPDVSIFWGVFFPYL